MTLALAMPATIQAQVNEPPEPPYRDAMRWFIPRGTHDYHKVGRGLAVLGHNETMASVPEWFYLWHRDLVQSVAVRPLEGHQWQGTVLGWHTRDAIARSPQRPTHRSTFEKVLNADGTRDLDGSVWGYWREVVPRDGITRLILIRRGFAQYWLPGEA